MSSSYPTELSGQQLKILSARKLLDEKEKLLAEKLEKKKKGEDLSLEEQINECEKLYGFYDERLNLDPKTGRIKIHVGNLSIVLNHRYNGNIKYSSLDECAFVNGEKISPEVQLKIRVDICRFLHGVNLKDSDIGEALDHIALENEFNRVKDYFESLVAPATSTPDILETWLIKVCGVKDTPINRIMSRKFLIAAAARGCEPGVYVEGSLIFVGGQGASKTLFLQLLAPTEDMYICEGVELSNTQKATQTMVGAFIVEMGELSQLNRMTLEEYKAYLTKKVDTYIPKYSNRNKGRKRHCVYTGNSNDMNILVDDTGNRRFWCFEVADKFDIQYLKEIKDELWYTAYSTYLSLTANKDPNDPVEPWVLTTSERKMLDDSNIVFAQPDSLVGFLDEELEKRFKYKTNTDWIKFHRIKEIAIFHQRDISDKKLARILVNSLKMERDPKSARAAQYKFKSNLAPNPVDILPNGQEVEYTYNEEVMKNLDEQFEEDLRKIDKTVINGIGQALRGINETT